MRADVGIIKLNSAEDWKEESSHCKHNSPPYAVAVVALVAVGEGGNTGQPQVVVGRLALPPRLGNREIKM